MNRTSDEWSPPGAHSPEPGATYYSRGGIRVTRNWVVIDGYRYAIRDLNDVRAGRSRPGSVTVNAGLALAVGIVAVALTARYLDAAGWLGAIVTLAVPGALFVLGMLRRARTHEMWAHYQGLDVKLMSTHDPHRCRQVYQAIHRATTHRG